MTSSIINLISRTQGSKVFGAKDFIEVDALLGRCLIVGFSAGLIIILIQSIAFKLALNISPASEEVELFASKYIEIRIFSAPAAIALFGITGWFIALERTKSVLLVQLFMNGLNVILDILLVNYFQNNFQIHHRLFYLDHLLVFLILFQLLNQ